MKRKLWVSIISVLAVVLLASVAIAAVVMQAFQVNFTVVAPSPVYGLSLYTDSACTIPFQPPVNLGNVEQGKSSSFIVYVKNTGNQALVVTATANTTVGSVSVSPSSSVNLAIGQSAGWTFSLSIPSNAPLGSSSYAVTFSRD